MMGEPRKPGARWRHQRPRARRRSAGWIKRGSVPALLAVLLSGTTLATLARADGDPASDYLVSNEVFLTSTYSLVDPVAGPAQLLATVRAANRAGFAIRVAMISTDYDLGSITALWRKPRPLRPLPGARAAVGLPRRLLVAMPSGFGFNWPAHPSAPSDRLLARVPAGAAGARWRWTRRKARCGGSPLRTG